MLRKLALTTIVGGALALSSSGAAFACGSGSGPDSSSPAGQTSSPAGSFGSWQGAARWAGHDDPGTAPWGTRMTGTAGATHTSTWSAVHPSTTPGPAANKAPVTEVPVAAPVAVPASASDAADCRYAAPAETWITAREAQIDLELARLRGALTAATADGDQGKVAAIDKKVHRLTKQEALLSGFYAHLVDTCGNATTTS